MPADWKALPRSQWPRWVVNAVWPSRRPTPLQTARWNAVQKAKCRRMPIRGAARELGIHRDTAKKYMEAVRPPMKRDRVGSTRSHLLSSRAIRVTFSLAIDTELIKSWHATLT